MHPYLVRQIRSDLAEIVEASAKDFAALENSPVVITGSSGFVGTWLTLSLLEARRQLGVSNEIVLVARNPASQVELLETAGYSSEFRTIAADVRSLDEISIPGEAWFMHAATPARATLNNSNPLEMIDIVVGGQKNVLDIAVNRSSRGVLFMSSGAVYGRQPMDLAGFREDWTGAPDIGLPANAYHEAKRMAELMGNTVQASTELSFVSARLFAFLAPFLPLNEHFAAGNFLGDALGRRQIHIGSGGGSIRSYQYGTDMAIWLWALLARGKSGSAYNVGSDEEITIRDLAHKIHELSASNSGVHIAGVDTAENVSRYVPDISRCYSHLGLSNEIQLSDAILRTLSWNREL